MAHIRPTPEGGSRRLALSAEDGQAQALQHYWCRPLGLKAAIANYSRLMARAAREAVNGFRKDAGSTAG